MAPGRTAVAGIGAAVVVGNFILVQTSLQKFPGMEMLQSSRLLFWHILEHLGTSWHNFCTGICTETNLPAEAGILSKRAATSVATRGKIFYEDNELFGYLTFSFVQEYDIHVDDVQESMTSIQSCWKSPGHHTIWIMIQHSC